MNRVFLILLIVFSFQLGNAQGEANVWYFGENAGLDFNMGSPVVLNNGALITTEGCATISDASGNLLFYTDGFNVYNRQHSLMPNTGLAGSVSSTHSAIIVPKPQDINIYYVFTVDAGGAALSYSELDMRLDSGLGDITINKNILLADPVNEKVTAIKKSGSDGFWVVSHRYNSDEFLIYEVTLAGVNTTPTVIPIGSNTGLFNLAGQIKISPDNSKLAVARGGEVQLFDFDNNTGTITNPQTINTGSFDSYGIEFSINGNLLYVAYFGGVNQYNLLAGSTANIIASEVVLVSVSNEGFASLQIAPDGKIYVARQDQFYIDFIANPNVIGTGCNYNYQGLPLNGALSNLGLPTFIQSFFTASIQVDNTCLGDITDFLINSNQTIDSISWDFGDGNSSILENPTHTYLTSGVFNVSATISSGGEIFSSNTVVTIYEQATTTVPQNIEICDSNNDGFHNFDLTQQDAAILNGQSAATFEVLYFESMAEYINDSPIATPTAYTNNTAYGTQTIIASVRNRGNDDCEAMTSFDIQVFETPLPSTAVPPIRLCDNDSVGSDTDGLIIFDLTTNETAILNGQSSTDFELQYFTDASLMLPISNPSVYQNTTATETIYVQMTNRVQAICTATTSFDIEVLALPVINSIVQLDQCDDDNDGISTFNLNEVANEITTNLTANTITFYSDLLDAQNSLNPITTIATYQNTTPSSQTLYARVENVNACYRTAQININVTTTQIPAAFLRTIYQCDDGTDLYDGIATFDLTGAQADIAALFPAGQTIDINFYRDELEALSEVNPIVNFNAYENIGYPNSQNIYVRVDNASNDCIGLGHHVTLVVESNPVAPSTIVIDQCDANNDGVEFIDTSTINAQLLQGQTNVDLTFRDTNGNLLPNPLPNPLTTASQTITVEMTNSNSLDTDGACAVMTQIDIVIEAGVVANPIPILEVCDTDNDGVFAFDTSAIESTLLGAQTGVSVRYEDQNGSLLSSPLPNPFNTSSQTITATVINPTNSFCFAQTQIEFVVNLTPEANAVVDDIICDDVSRDNQHLFDLSNYDAQVLNGQAATDFIITYHLNQSDATTGNNPLPNSYTSTSTRETLFVRIENRHNGTCNDTSVSFDIGVSRLPIANQPADIHFCDDSSNDGTEVFDLRFRESDILNGQSITDNLITYHISQSDANLGINELPIDFSNTTASQDIYVRVENIRNTDCFSTTSFSINVYEQPVLFMQEQWAICENDTVELIADLGFDNYLWSTGETTSSIIVDMPGSYSVTVSNDYGAIICEETKDILVVESTIAVITNVEIEDWSQNNNSVFIEVNGSGDYEYSLDGISYQESNRFDNLPMGDYQIYVRDKNGCGVVEQDIYLLFYPRYFTPNGDGFHDYWQLFNSDQEPGNKIYIFDRYGKLMKQIAPEGPGWDGTFNGLPVPSSDYWFLVERANGKSYRGHFTLKR
jgi:gliding motility-associated-like protein